MTVGRPAILSMRTVVPGKDNVTQVGVPSVISETDREILDEAHVLADEHGELQICIRFRLEFKVTSAIPVFLSVSCGRTPAYDTLGRGNEFFYLLVRQHTAPRV